MINVANDKATCENIIIRQPMVDLLFLRKNGGHNSFFIKSSMGLWKLKERDEKMSKN